MKKRIQIILFALTTGLFLLSAGGSGDDEPSKPLYQDKYAIEATFGSLIKDQLRDPDSYEYISAEPYSNEYMNDGHYFTIKYRAKNGFGGYNICTAIVSCDSTTMRLISNE